jgi:hypothetical protein
LGFGVDDRCFRQNCLQTFDNLRLAGQDGLIWGGHFHGHILRLVSKYNQIGQMSMPDFSDLLGKNTEE